MAKKRNTDPNRVRVDLNSTRPRFRQIQDHILARIAEGKLAPGDQLPPLRQWASETGVATETMSKAVRELVAKGVLDARPKWGTRVAARGTSRRSRVDAVGIVNVEAYQAFMETSRFYATLMPLVQKTLMAHHERVIHERWTRGKPMTELFDHMRLVDAVLLLGNVRYPIAQIRAVEKLGVPVVILGTEMRSKDVHIVRSDDIADSRHAVVALAKMGHKRIAAWLDPQDPRGRGYAEGLADLGIPYRKTYVMQQHADDYEDVADRVAALKPKPTALFLARHLNVAGALVDALGERGVRAGTDLYICAYDDDLWHGLAPRGIAYARIEQPLDALAQTASEILLARIEGSYDGPKHTLLPSRFVAMDALA